MNATKAFLCGVGLAAMIGLLMSFQPLAQTARLVFLNHPRDMVTIRGDQTYLVPNDKPLVVTGIGSTNQLAGAMVAYLEVGGQRELALGANLPQGSSIAMHVWNPIPPSVVVQPGSQVRLVIDGPGGQSTVMPTLRLFGYLSDR